MKKSITSIGVYVTVFLVVTNAAFWLLGWYYDATRPWVNIDYLLVIPFLLIRTKLFISLGFLAFLSIFTLDCLLWVRQFFPFLTLADFTTLGPLVLNGPDIYLYLLCFSCAVGLLTFWIVFYVQKTINNIELIGSFFILILMWASFSGAQYQSEKATIYESSGVIESQILYANKLKENFIVKSFSWKPKFSKSPYASVVQERLKGSDSKKVVFIIMESWGAFTDSKQQQFIDDFKSTLAPTSIFEYGTSYFEGATINGELRELCKLQVDHYNLKDVSQDLQNCIPHRYSNRKYHTLAMHAANSSIYDRGKWYKDAGFKSTLFFEQLKSRKLCRSFPGKCDVDLFYVLDDALQTHPKLFFYWLTLNSHYPYKNSDIAHESLNCINFDVSRETEECRNILLNFQFLQKLSEKSHAETYKDVEFFIIGDHEPPILKSGSKKPLFKENTVSWIHFKIESK